MNFFSALCIIAGGIGLPVFMIAFVIQVIRKRPMKRIMTFLAAGLAVFLVGCEGTAATQENDPQRTISDFAEAAEPSVTAEFISKDNFVGSAMPTIAAEKAISPQSSQKGADTGSVEAETATPTAKSTPTPTAKPTAAPTAKPTATPTPEPTQRVVINIPDIVYWTPNGKSYHSTSGCGTLSRSKTILQGTLEEAFSAGKKDPCDKCVH